MQRTVQRSVGEHVYEVRQLPATPAYLMFLDLAKMLAPSMAAGVAAVSGRGSLAETLDAEIDGGFLVRAVEGLVERLDNAKVQAVIQQLANHTAVVVGEGKLELGQQFEAHFAGRIGEMFKWLLFALEVNFGDFLSGCRAKARTVLQGMTPAPSPSPTTSSGPSGGSSSSG